MIFWKRSPGMPGLLAATLTTTAEVLPPFKAELQRRETLTCIGLTKDVKMFMCDLVKFVLLSSPGLPCRKRIVLQLYDVFLQYETSSQERAQYSQRYRN